MCKCFSVQKLLCVKVFLCKAFLRKEVRRAGKSSWSVDTRWAVKMSWEWGEMNWAEVRRGGKSRGGKRWAELRRVEKSQQEVGRGESHWEELRRAGKMWKELSWGGKRWNLRAVEKSCENWEELRWPEKSWEVVVTMEKGWGKVTTNPQNQVEKLWGSAASPIGKPRLWIL
jgi:hypothetical protein